ncbi:hypothetical protein ACI79C_05360 [Geodermatophilus sp. SYSU D00697]
MIAHGALAATREQLIPLDAPDRWRRALARVRHGFAHTWGHCYAMHLSSGLATYLYETETPNAVFVCPIAERVFDETVDVVTPYGFSGFAGEGTDEELPGLWRRWARERGYVSGFLMQNPLLSGSPYEVAGEAHTHKHVYAIDLTRPVDELYARLHTNRRRQLRRWDQITAGLVVDRVELTAFLLDHYRAFFRARDATSVYDLAPESLAFLAGLDNVVMVGAADSGRVTAVSMFGYTATCGDYLFNVSAPEGRRHSAALIWYAVLRLRSLGVPWLNLGGGVAEDDGVARFKQRFGADVLPLTYLKQVYDPVRYSELCRRAGADPDDLTGWFPPYRRP